VTYQFRNLVFEGGGVKGIAYLGALEVLEQKGVMDNIIRVGGTSAGAINAVLLALGYDRDEMTQILMGLDFHNFMDSDWGVVRDTHRLIHQYGWYKGDFFRRWMEDRIRDKTGVANATFSDLQGFGAKDLYLVGTNLSTGFAEVFSAAHTPDMPVAEAARISMSIPLFFAAIRNDRDDVYVDGGLLNNYPVKLFDRAGYLENPMLGRAAPYYEPLNAALPGGADTYVYNKETLGFRLDSRQEIEVFRDGHEPAHRNIDDFFDYAFALVHTVMEAQANQHLHSDDWHRTVYIDTLGVKTTDFGLSDDRKQALIQSGRDGARAYFDWYDTADDLPLNHPDRP